MEEGGGSGETVALNVDIVKKQKVEYLHTIYPYKMAFVLTLFCWVMKITHNLHFFIYQELFTAVYSNYNVLGWYSVGEEVSTFLPLNVLSEFNWSLNPLM